MFKKKEYYKWQMIKLIGEKKYRHISFVTAYYFLGIPIYKYEKYVPNKIDQFDIEEEKVGYVETIPQKKTGTYNPIKDESKILNGEVDSSFE